MLEKWVEEHFKDLSVYRFGGQTLLNGLPLYEGADPATVLPFTYPPFAALLFVPLTVLPWPVLVAVWSAASFAALVLVCRLYGVPGRWLPVGVAVAALALEPVWSTLTLGQVNLFLLLLVSADLLRGADRRWGGVLIGVAAGIKLTPLIFIFFLLLVGRRDMAGRAVGALAGTVAVGFVVLPRDAVEFWTHAVLDPGRVGGVPFARNQSVLALLTRLLGEEPSKPVWLLVAGPLALGVLLLARRAWLRDDRPLAVVLVGLAMLLASPISWSHHWVWVVPALVVLARSGWSRRWVAGGLVAAVFASCCILWPPSKDDRELAWNPLEQLAGNAYLWVALAALLLLARHRAAVGTASPGLSHSGHPA
ncbi:glycosyltransferase 87 family protein [Nocardioides speluncae]|uniref:glycosyltransferase 87 family protein n=1 Tax=Nocardioides speluncae TaxID=2670337 RepID=UPI000D68F8E9|nr:glycosyltransferase 87 family protein [Nocardioides speluncae]